MVTDGIQVGTRRGRRVPPQIYLGGSAAFHYLGPAFAVLLFAPVAPLGVAWLRITSAGVGTAKDGRVVGC